MVWEFLLKYFIDLQLFASQISFEASLRDEDFFPGKRALVYECIPRSKGNSSPSEVNGDARPLVLGAGSIIPRKGVDLFVEVARLSKLNRLDCQFIWAGSVWKKEADYAQRCFSAAVALENEPFVDFPGHQDSLDSLLQRTSVFLLTSRDDPMPLVVGEALERGIPVVCFNVDGVSTILAKEDIIEPFCADKMQARLEEILRNGPPMAASYRAIYEKYYSPEGYAARICQILG